MHRYSPLSVVGDTNDVAVISWEALHRFLRSLAHFVELIHTFQMTYWSFQSDHSFTHYSHWHLPQYFQDCNINTIPFYLVFITFFRPWWSHLNKLLCALKCSVIVLQFILFCTPKLKLLQITLGIQYCWFIGEKYFLFELYLLILEVFILLHLEEGWARADPGPTLRAATHLPGPGPWRAGPGPANYWPDPGPHRAGPGRP